MCPHCTPCIVTKPVGSCCLPARLLTIVNKDSVQSPEAGLFTILMRQKRAALIVCALLIAASSERRGGGVSGQAGVLDDADRENWR